jgi:tetratricopeptide (TPR) repeat protein
MIHKLALAYVCLGFFCAMPCLSQPDGADQQQIQSLENRAQEYLNQKRPNLAIPQFEALTKLDPKNVNAQANLGVLLYFQGDYAKAQPHLRAAIDLQPGLAKIEGLVGIAEKRTGDVPHAREHLEKSFPALEDGKFKIQAGMELIELYTANGDLELAAGIVGRLRQAEPENLEVQYAAYRIYSDLAGDSMLTLSLVGPDSAQMHQAMAQEAQRQNNSESAIAQERAAMKVNPHLPGAHFELAELLSASGNVSQQEEALREYLAALAENQYDERAECGLGKIYARKGDLTQALIYYSAAVTLRADDAEANSGMAQTLIGMNQESKALPYLEAAIKLEPTDAPDHYRLSRLYRQQGRIEDAKQELALYQKYKEMREKLRTIYKDLRLPPGANEPEEVNQKVD